MGWVLPRTWVTGEVVTASIMNSAVKSNFRYLKGLDGGVTVEDDLTVDNLITSGNVDGVDVSTHKAGTAKAQHTAGAGNHTHQSAGAEGATIDHGAALTGKGDDDHTQYALRTILTTRGDMVFRNASDWARLAKGTQGEFLKQGADDPEWVSGATPTVAIKTSDESVTGSEAMQDDDDLFLSVGANSIWRIFAYYRINTSSLADMDTAWTIPAAATMVSNRDLLGQASHIAPTTEFDATTVDFIAGAGTDQYVTREYLYIGGANAGTVQLQWAQSASQGTATKMLANSFILCWQLV